MSFIASMFGSTKEASVSTHGPSSVSQVGGDIRDDGKVSFGYSLMRGKRSNMEDCHYAQFRREPKSGEVLGLFGVFDGHGGSNAAEYVKANLFINLVQHSKFGTDARLALAEAYENTDCQYLKHDSSSSRDDGCTAVTAVLLGQRLVVANVGDSRAVLCRRGQAIPMTVDHKPNSKEERQRIEKAGGVVVWAGTWRVGGVLAVSRAFGDRPLKQYVIPTPDIRDEWLSHDDEFLILASDGLWDVVSNQDAVQLVKDIQNAEAAAKRLTEEAYHRGSNDNISCVVIRFKF